MELKRRMFEPRDRIDRIIYALFALTGPNAVIAAFGNPEIRFAAAVMGMFLIVSAFYTIEWAVLSYRKWRTGVSRP